MALPKLFQRIFFHNNATPALNEDNLNAISKAIDDIDDRVIALGDDVLVIVPQIQAYLDQADDLVEALEALTTNPPYIGENGNWYTWDTDSNAYVDSGVDASITVNIADITMLAPDATPYVTNTGTDTDPIFHLFIPRGQKGENGTNGADGADGADGVSPTITITTITGGHRVTITDADHPSGQSFDVMDGTTTLNALTDVNLTSPSDGNALVYDSSTQKWVNRSVGGMATDGSNAASHVTFSGAFTVGSRANASTVGTNSTVEGNGNTASGSESHAEGYNTRASGEGSHAEGTGTRASGNNSHAEGISTTASGNYSHAEGSGTTAGGQWSHAEGNGASTSGQGSHAEGYQTRAGYNNQHVSGKYNDNKSTTLFEIGNGTADNARSNAFEVYSDGSMSNDNGTTKTKLPVIKTATLASGSTSVSFTNMPSSGNYMVNFFTSKIGLDYSSISQSGTTVTLTYPAQSSATTVWCVLTEVM